MKKINSTEVCIGVIGLIICLIAAKICTAPTPVNRNHLVDTIVVADRPAVYHFHIYPE